MSNVFGGPLSSGVRSQLDIRNSKYSKLSGRTNNDLLYLTSKTGWVKLTSGVNIGGSEAKAKDYILVGGTLGRFGDQAYSNYDGKLGKGFRPMPGITGVTVKTLNAFGTLKEATVTFNCWDVSQIRDLEMLYMRPGFSALLEWGHSIYFTSEEDLSKAEVSVSKMLTQEVVEGEEKKTTGPGNKESIKSEIEKLRQESKYNYDGILGLITNFSWSFRPDGGYDCTTTISSIGNLIESSVIDTDVSANTQDNSVSSSQDTQPATMIETILKEVKTNTFTSVFNISNNYPDYWTKFKTVNGEDSMEVVPNSSVTTNFATFSGLNAIQQQATLAAERQGTAWITLKSLCKIINASQLIDQNNNNIVKLNTKYGRSPNFRTFPEHVSSDPGICIIVTDSADKWHTGLSKALDTVKVGKTSIGSSSANDILNIYVHVDLIYH
jgi:hypothetical protein